MSIGKNIAKHRKAKNLTQEEFGAKLGVTNQAVSKWELEISFPDIMLLPQIAHELGITLNDLYATETEQESQQKSNVFNVEGIHHFPKEAQSLLIDSLYHKTNLINCRSWEFLKTPQNLQTKKYDSVKKHYTMCCLSDTKGAAFISNNQTIIDCEFATKDIDTLFENFEIASGLKKLADNNVRNILSHICNEYFHSSAPFDCGNSEYFEKDIKLSAISQALNLTSDETLNAIEKLISLHIIDTKTEDDGTHYMFQKIKAIEVATTFRLIERLLQNQVGYGCGDFGALTR